MSHPLFSAAWSTELLYKWDSRTATGVFELYPCRGRQVFSLSAASGEKTPDGESALLFRAIGGAARRIVSIPQVIAMQEGDAAGVAFWWKAPRAMSVTLALLGHRRSVRCGAGWNRVRVEVPASRRLDSELATMDIAFSGMDDGDFGFMGTLRLYLRTDRHVSPPVFPCREIKPGPDWRECDLSDLYVKTGSVLDFSYLVPPEDIDALGRLTVTPDGHFAYENRPGRPVRLFGHSMALTRSTIPETHAEIDAFADALRNQGYNLVRIHGLNALLMDASRGWDGTLPAKPQDIPLLPGAEERLHWFVHALRRRGIHLYLDMCTFINGWHSGDVWFGGGIALNRKEGLTRYCTRFIDGDPAVRANWRAGVLRVMTARNPYTGLRLADDPCVAFVLGFNELLIHPCREWARRLRASRKTEAELRFDTLEETARFIDRVIRETGYTGLVNQYDNSRALVNLAVGSRYPSITNHLYHWCPHKFFYPGSSQWASGAIFSGVGYLRQAARMRFADKPYGVTEYGEPYWNSHRFQQGLGFGAYSAFQDFDLLVMHSTPVMKSGGELRPFSGGNDPAVRAAEVITGCAFLRGDVAPARHRAVWEFDRTFMLENFDRWTESTASFAALLTGIALAYESRHEADFHLPLQVAPKGEFFGPEFYTKFKGSPPFDAFVEELRRRGILQAGNATEPARGVYETETGELRLDIMKELLTASTPRLEGALLPAGEKADLPHFRIHPGNTEASLALIAQDGFADLDHCRRALLVCATNALNTDSKFLVRDDTDDPNAFVVDTESRTYKPQKGEEVLLDNGHAPVLRRVRRGSFEVRLPAMKCPVVYAVTFNGERAERIPAKMREGWLRFSLAEAPSPFFEIVDSQERVPGL